jgi:hypothetical protein
VNGVHDPAQATPSSYLLVGRAIERAIIDELLRDAERGVAAAVLFAGPLASANRRWSTTR